MQARTFSTRSGATLSFTPVGLGTAPIGDLYRRLDEGDATATVRLAHASGVRLFDSSPHYGNGLAEARSGAALRALPRDGFLFSTKVGRRMEPLAARLAPRDDVISPGFAGGFPHAAVFDYGYDGAMRSVEQSLLRTGFGRIDILLIHDCDVWTHGAAEVETRFAEAMSGAYRALERLRGDGTVAAIGVGINEADMAERFVRAGDFDLVLLAGRYSLLEQPALDSFLPLAEARGVGVMLAGVFNSGILATGAVPGAKYNYREAAPDIMAKVARMEASCRAHGVTLRQAAMAFAAAHPATLCLLLGAETGAEISANVADFGVPVPAALWADLRDAGLLAAAAPTP